MIHHHLSRTVVLQQGFGVSLCLEQRAIALARNMLEKELDDIKKSNAGEELRFDADVELKLHALHRCRCRVFITMHIFKSKPASYVARRIVFPARCVRTSGLTRGGGPCSACSAHKMEMVLRLSQAIDTLELASRGLWKDELEFDDDHDDDDHDDGSDDDDSAAGSRLDPSFFQYACAMEQSQDTGRQLE
jgi:hypothetical protein